MESINIGSTANDHTGDTVREAFRKTKANFEEVGTEIISIATSATTNFRADQASVVLLPDGRYLMAFGEVTGNIADSGLFDIFICHSSDGGKTYSTPVKAFNRIGGFSSYIPSLCVRADNSVYMILLVQPTLTTSELWKVESTDQGSTFSGAQTKLYGVALEYYAPASDRIFTTQTGRRLYVFNRNTNPPNLGSQNGNYVGMILYSDNDTNSSATWTVAGTTGSNTIISPDNLCAEPGIYSEFRTRGTYDAAEVLVCYFRTRSNYVYAARSLDNGLTWGGGPTNFSTGLHAPNSTTTIKYDATRRIFIAAANLYWTDHGYKDKLLLWASRDAKTWNFVTVIDYITVDPTLDFCFEPIIYFVGNLIKIVYSRTDFANSVINLKQATIPFDFVFNVAVEEYNNIKIKKRFDDGTTEYFEIYADGVTEANGYYKIRNTSGNGNVFGTWIQARSFTASSCILKSIVNPANGVGEEWNFSSNGSTTALTGSLLRARNGAFNGSGGTIPWELHSTYHKTTLPEIIDADITPTQLAANTNDYAPTGIATASTLRLSTDASRDLTGIAGGSTMVDGREITIVNIGAFNLVLKTESASSTAANRFLLGADVTVTPEQAVRLFYDATSSRWRKLF